MSEEKVITPFEQGICAAMMLIGKAIATNPALDVEELKQDAQRIMSAMPSEPKWVGGSSGIHQAAIHNLLIGIEKVSR
ncbi:hypothetical protein PSFL_21910 [Pseudomonas sp. DD1]|uniref:hypothetical protein n=1 Tax=Pseudomonas sp. DD1 TaxID=879558 RepID=UPI0037C7B069